MTASRRRSAPGGRQKWGDRLPKLGVLALALLTLLAIPGRAAAEDVCDTSYDIANVDLTVGIAVAPHKAEASGRGQR